MTGGEAFLLYLGGWVIGGLGFWWQFPRPGEAKAGAGELDDYEVALLSGGVDRAVALAMLRLCHSGAIDTRRRHGNTDGEPYVDGPTLGRRVDRVGPLPAHAHDVERVVYERASSLPLAADLRRRACSSPVLVSMRHRLFDLGLMVRRTPAGEQWWRLLVWSSYATVWVMITAGLLTSEPDDGWLAGLFLVHSFLGGVVAFLWTTRPTMSRTTTAGTRVCHELWRRLQEDERSGDASTAQTGVGLSWRRIALGGCYTLWDGQRVLAEAWALPDEPVEWPE